MMEKLEKFYKGKFENHEEAPMPDAFDRIMKELENDNEKGREEAGTTTKPFSSLLKISLSLNALLIVAIPVMYYLLSNNAETPTTVMNKTQQNDQISQPLKMEDSRISTESEPSMRAEKAEIKNEAEGKKKNKVETNAPVSLQKDIPVKATASTALVQTEENTMPVEIKTEEQPVEVKKEKEVVNNTKTERKKRNVDLYYEENASKLKDSTNLLFKKKK